jgi:phosphate-selective porin OprO and OprP
MIALCASIARAQSSPTAQSTPGAAEQPQPLPAPAIAPSEIRRLPPVVPPEPSQVQLASAIAPVPPATSVNGQPTPFRPIERLATLQPLSRDDPGGDRTQQEQRIRDLEGLGPAPGTTAQDENKSSGSVPNKPTVAWTGELQTDDVTLSQSPANRADLGDIDGFSNFRRARLGAIGSLWANTIYRLEFDFAQQARPSFLDVYGQLTDLAILGNLRVGHFFEPFSLQRLTSNRYQTFMERPLLDAFAPSRNLGIMAFDTFADKHGTWQLGVFGTDSNDDGEEQTDRGGEAITGRTTFLPYWDEPSDGRYYMHVGGCFSYRMPAKQQGRYGYWPGFRPGAFDTIVWPRWADTGIVPVHDAALVDLEWAWIMGPFHIQAEYAASFVDQIGGPDLTFTAWYVETGWFLTGESRPYQQEMAIFNRVTPYESFFSARTKDGIRRGRGAWQVAFRVEDLNLNNRNIQGGNLFDLTLGLNWYVNPYTRVYFNYVHAILSGGEPGNFGNLFGVRAQFEF